MQRQETPPVLSKWRRVTAALVLLALLLQVSLFFAGLMDPVQRTVSLWGKSREERLTVVWQPGRVLSAIAQQFPVNARILLMYPDPLTQYNLAYYSYPRTITLTLTNGLYQTAEELRKWDEHPTDALLLSNHITHVITFKNGGKAWQVMPGVEQQIAAWEQTHASR